VKKTNWKDRFTFNSIRFKITFCVVIVGIVLLLFSLWLLSDSMVIVEDDLMDDRLASDIQLMRDVLGEREGKLWRLENGALYIGDTLIGDGTAVHANVEPFFHCEEVTGTFFYSFVRTFNDDELVWVGDNKTGYMQGHYLRTAGTTKGPRGENIVGTYMDKKVADILDREGVYSGEANVNGRMIYCRYEILEDVEGKTVGAVVVGRSIVEMKQLIHNQKARSAIIFGCVWVLMAMALAFIVGKMISSIKLINDRLQLIGSGEFPQTPLEVRSRDELGEVTKSINSMVRSLEEKERIGAELSIATDIQANMLPGQFPAFPDHNEFDIFASMRPAKEVGGDFYDFFMVDPSHIAVVIGDVSGKGVPAALFMVVAKTLIKTYSQMGDSPSGDFTRVNHILCEGNESGLFVTAWMGVIDLETGVMNYVNAGHNPPMLCSRGTFSYLKGKSGLVLAGMDGVKYRPQEVTLRPGDRLFLYTDGVTEATDDTLRLYGERRLSDFLNSHSNESARRLVKKVAENVDTFVGEAPQFDDITMLAFDYLIPYNDETVTRTFPATIEALPQAMAFLEQRLEALECPPKAAMQISVAVEELFVNIAHYAYRKETGEMQLCVEKEGDAVKVTLVDGGVPFDPTAYTEPDVTESAEKRKIGGLGIFMVKKTMDFFEYHRLCGKNIVVIKK